MMPAVDWRMAMAIIALAAASIGYAAGYRAGSASIRAGFSPLHQNLAEWFADECMVMRGSEEDLKGYKGLDPVLTEFGRRLRLHYQRFGDLVCAMQ